VVDFFVFLLVATVLLTILIVYLLLRWQSSYLPLLFSLIGLLTGAILYLVYREATAIIAVALLAASLLSVATNIAQNYRRWLS
jgi:hypothetical protein